MQVRENGGAVIANEQCPTRVIADLPAPTMRMWGFASLAMFRRRLYKLAFGHKVVKYTEP
jgi:hypothetical protein